MLICVSTMCQSAQTLVRSPHTGPFEAGVFRYDFLAGRGV